jgi:hypothetical protein
METWSFRLGLGVGLTTLPWKKSTGNLRCGLGTVRSIGVTGRSPLRRRRSSLDCRAIYEEEEEEEEDTKALSDIRTLNFVGAVSCSEAVKRQNAGQNHI